MGLTNDTIDAFVDYPAVPVPSADSGPLAGKTLAVKDLFDVAGYPTGGGHPLVRELGGVRTAHAPVVKALLDASARFIGKTHTDEFAYSMNGENAHYGRPANPNAPGRITGGSSSGSVSAIAAGLADIALGSDTGGSVRLPASYCGLIGLRTTHGRISRQGVHPLAESLDTVGWFARDLETYIAVGEVLLGNQPAQPVKRLMVADDIAEQVVGAAERAETERMLEQIARHLPIAGHLRLALDGFDEWRQVFRTIQAFEAWRAHGQWIETHNPQLGDGIRDRFAWAKTVSAADYDMAQARRAEISAHIRSQIPAGTALVFPTVPSGAPLPGRSGDGLEGYRIKAIAMTCSAGLAGLPQLTLPLGDVDALPFGLSLLGPADSDMSLLKAARPLLAA
jgi:amidase